MVSLFSWPTTTRILVYQWRVNHHTSFNALLNPEIRLNVFIRVGLIVLDKMLEDFSGWIGENDAR